MCQFFLKDNNSNYTIAMQWSNCQPPICTLLSTSFLFFLHFLLLFCWVNLGLFTSNCKSSPTFVLPTISIKSCKNANCFPLILTNCLPILKGDFSMLTMPSIKHHFLCRKHEATVQEAGNSCWRYGDNKRGMMYVTVFLDVYIASWSG